MSVSDHPTLEIADAHVHIWDLDTGLYPRRMERRRGGDVTVGNYLVNDLLSDADGLRLTKAVHIEGFPSDGLAEARHVQAIADTAPSGIPQAIVAHASLADPRLDETLRHLAVLPNVRGIRDAWCRSGETRNLYDDASWCRGFGLLDRYGLSFELQLNPTQASGAAALLSEHPTIRVVVNHLGWPKTRGFEQWRAWRRGLRTLAGLQHVWVKVSGVGMFDPSWTTESLRPYAFEALDAFGDARVMFASNFPVDRAWSGYRRLWETFGDLIAALPSEQQSRLLCGNAETFYRI